MMGPDGKNGRWTNERSMGRPRAEGSSMPHENPYKEISCYSHMICYKFISPSYGRHLVISETLVLDLLHKEKSPLLRDLDLPLTNI